MFISNTGRNTRTSVKENSLLKQQTLHGYVVLFLTPYATAGSREEHPVVRASVSTT